MRLRMYVYVHNRHSRHDHKYIRYKIIHTCRCTQIFTARTIHKQNEHIRQEQRYAYNFILILEPIRPLCTGIGYAYPCKY